MSAAALSGCLRLTSEESGGAGGTGSNSDQVQSEGDFEIRYADADGSLETAVGDDGIAETGPVEQQQGMYTVSVTLTSEAAQTLVEELRDVGAFENPSAHPIFTYFSGQEIQSFQLSRDLIASMRNGDFQSEPTFVIQVEDRAFARAISDSR